MYDEDREKADWWERAGENAAAQKGMTRQGGKGSKSGGRRNSLRTDARRHSCNEGESPYGNSTTLNLNNFPLSLYRVHVDEGRESVQATVAERPIEETMATRWVLRG